MVMKLKARRSETNSGRGRGVLVDGVDQAWREAEALGQFGGFRPFSERRKELRRLTAAAASWHSEEG